jgi:tetratricopeptide (TPR) repeat protein
VIGPLLLLLRLAASVAADEAAGLEAYRAGRYDDASRLLAQAMAEAPSYDGLLALGLADGRLGRHAEAAASFERALALDAQRPEAWLERGGLRFLMEQYQAAVPDLRHALSLKEDPYARDLLAASLQLSGRSEEALGTWNAMGQPMLRRLEIKGLEHTKDPVARRELRLAEGEVLDLARLRESRLRLREVGVFDRVTLRPAPIGNGQADLDVVLSEQHGFARGLGEFALTTAAYAARGTAHLRYANLAGQGLSLAGDYRWQEHRRQLAFGLDWPRPAGLDAVLRLRAFDGRQDYDFDGSAYRLEARGADIGLRRVLGSRTVGALTLRTRDRVTFPPRQDAPPGRSFGIEAGLERRLLESHRHRLDVALRVLGAPAGATPGYARGVAVLKHEAFLSPPEGVFFERSLLEFRVVLGRGSESTPLDEMFAPGGSPEMELPLRGRRQRDDGRLGEVPLGRELVLANLEWRRRLVSTTFAQFGIVFFYDGAHIGAPAEGAAEAFHDVGAGLRIALAGSTWLRADYGRGLTDGRSAFFVNFGQVF